MTASLTHVRDATASDLAVPHLYVHFPFCARKCPYCDFNSHAGRDAEQAAYVGALMEEARRWRGRAALETVFIGGGTPTHVSASLLERYLDGVFEALGASSATEITIEANPGSLDREKVRVLRAMGVHRVSLGVQSFDDRHLAALGRVHVASDAVRGVELLREGGMPRFSVDLMLAVPNQTLGEQERDLARAIDLAPEHVSAYVLTFEEGTAFTKLMREGRMTPPDAERDVAHLHLACERFAAAGYGRYEISNFARPGAECRHNLAYWRNRKWLGIGAGAHSHVGDLRWKNVDDPATYTARIRSGEDPTDWSETIDPRTRLFECLMMGLRLIEGIDADAVTAYTGIDPRVLHADEFASLEAEGLLEQEGAQVRLTSRGLDVSNRILVALAP